VLKILAAHKSFFRLLVKQFSVTVRRRKVGEQKLLTTPLITFIKANNAINKEGALTVNAIEGKGSG
jgi:hypothetical protein